MEQAPVLHQAMLAYASDFGLLRPALLPHQLHLSDGRLLIASPRAPRSEGADGAAPAPDPQR